MEGAGRALLLSGCRAAPTPGLSGYGTGSEMEVQVWSRVPVAAWQVIKQVCASALGDSVGFRVQGLGFGVEGAGFSFFGCRI